MNMFEPTVTVVKDGDGNPHWMSSTSKMLIDGLANGTFTRVEEEAKPDEATVLDARDDHDPGSDDGGPKRSSGSGESDGGDPAGADKPKTRR